MLQAELTGDVVTLLRALQPWVSHDAPYIRNQPLREVLRHIRVWIGTDEHVWAEACDAIKLIRLPLAPADGQIVPAPLLVDPKRLPKVKPCERVTVIGAEDENWPKTEELLQTCLGRKEVVIPVSEDIRPFLVGAVHIARAHGERLYKGAETVLAVIVSWEGRSLDFDRLTLHQEAPALEVPHGREVRLNPRNLLALLDLARLLGITAPVELVGADPLAPFWFTLAGGVGALMPIRP